MALLSEIAPHLGLRPARLAALNYFIGRTRASDWTSIHCEPVFFGGQEVAAADLGKTPRQLRSDEAALARLGLIAKRVAANGARYGRAGLGLIMTPLIERLEEFVDLRDRLRAERLRIRELKDLRSLRLRHMKRLIAALPSWAAQDPEITKNLQEFASWPRSDALTRLGLVPLENHLTATADLCEKLEAWFENNQLSSGEPAENFRSFTQNIKEEIQSVGEDGAVDKFGESGEDQAAEHPETIQVTPENLYDQAGDDLRMVIDAHRVPGRSLRERDIIEAAQRLMPMLAIHPSVWREGQATIGDHATALFVLQADAGRTHATAPVRNPGGWARAMIRRAALTRSTPFGCYGT